MTWGMLILHTITACTCSYRCWCGHCGCSPTPDCGH